MVAPLILGHSGLVGQALLDEDAGLKVFSGGRREFDLTADYHTIKKAIKQADVKLCINCIAMAHVDDCERQPAQAWQVNSQGPAKLAFACAALNVRLIHLSTDYVFDGNANQPYAEDQPCAPLNAYGKSKLAGEMAIMLHHPGALVARTSWVFGPARDTWLERPWRQWQSGHNPQVVDDQLSCPTWSKDLAKALLFLAEHPASGLLHVTGQGYASRLLVCRELFSQAGLAPELIAPAKSSDFPGLAPRPAFSALNGARLKALGYNMLPWQQALARHYQEIK